MGFSVPSPFGVSPTEGEELFKKAWEVFGDNVIDMMDTGWKYALQGKSDKANRYFQGANIYFYMVFVAQAARYTLQMKGLIDEECNGTAVDEQYGLSCIESNWPCVSRFFGQDYGSAWYEIMDVFGIDRDTDNCDSCCVGIGEMIIEDDNDCIAFIIGPCEDIDPYEPMTPDDDFGEFKLGEIVIGQVTNFNEE